MIRPASPGSKPWKVIDVAGVKAVRDETKPHSGSSSLRLDFDAPDNIWFRHVSQFVWLEPGREDE